MTGRIERQATGPRPKAENLARTESPPKAAAVSARAPTAQWNNGGRPAGPALEGSGPGHVALSAQPEALWGSSSGRGSDDQATISRLSPADRAAKLTELQGRRDAMQVKILERVAELDKKWESSTTATKTEALRDYSQLSQQLDPQTKQELQGMVDVAENCQRRIDRLGSRRAGLAPARHADAATRRQRSELNAELRAARKEQKVAVKAATAVIDDRGLKVDRLAVTEQVIDPSAPKAGEPTSLLGMVKEFCSLSWLVDWLSSVLDHTDLDLAKKKGLEREEVLVKDLQHQQVQQRLVANREALKQLSAAARLRNS